MYLRKAAACLLLLCLALSGQQKPGNKPERLEWFRDLGFGMFIHWGADVQLGSVISHSLVGASQDYVDRWFTILPRHFNPTRFNPREWASLAKLAGMKYVVIGAKHHSGFCMFQTKTTGFSVMNTPFGRDVTAETIQAFREQQIAIGIYISPDDFHWFREHGYTIARPPAPKTTTREIPELMEYGKTQVRELLTNYGKVDVFFIDGPADGLREQAWETQPDIVVTRGAIETPEQHVPGIPMDEAWEACMTMGTQWQYKPHDERKSSRELIEMLIEIRAKGGNLLLNIGPRPDGALSEGEESRLRDIALWNFVNQEALDAVRPWVITNERNIWFTRKKNEPTVYAFLAGPPSKLGDTRTVTLSSVMATEHTKVDLLGQSGEVLEYRPDIIPRTTWKQTADGLVITATHAQRLYNDRRWPFPWVLRITHAQAALAPPEVSTESARWDDAAGAWILQGDLKGMGDAKSLEVSFQYRPRKGLTDLYEKTEPWRDLPARSRAKPGLFAEKLSGVTKDQDYEFRALVKHPLITLYGAEKPVNAGKVVKLH